MERGSDKHGPRVDEELDHETRSLRQGAPVESRVEEHREQEGPGEVLERLQALPAGRAYENVQAVWAALGGTVEHRF